MGTKGIFCCIFVSILLQKTKAQRFYTAAVVEHAPLKESTPIYTLEKNLNDYRSFVEQAKNQYNADIIVFPEYGLTTIINEDLEDYAIVIQENNSTFEHKILVELKRMAIDHYIYIVVNLLEKDFGYKNKSIIYNTNLVFDRYGKIIAKYRKINLFNEDKLTPGNQIVTFTTDFGVTFGLFTCFDILFHNPSREILRNGQVTDVIFPTAWFSTLPFYSALSVQSGYATANGVNLLASNYNNPKKANGGSGIYLANGRIGQIILEFSHSSKLVAHSIEKIPRRLNTECQTHLPKSGSKALLEGFPAPKDVSSFITNRDFNPSDYTFHTLDLNRGENQFSKSVCNGKFCCNFNITLASTNTEEHYKLVVFDGKTTLNRKKEHIRFCALIACATADVNSCGNRFEPMTKFSRISIESNFTHDSNTSFYQPITLKSDLTPITSEVFYCSSYENNNTFTHLSMEGTFQDNILVFGIYGRSSGMVHSLSLFLGVAVLLRLLAEAIFGPIQDLFSYNCSRNRSPKH